MKNYTMKRMCETMEENKISENIVEKIGITKEWTYIGSAPCNIKPQGSTDSFRFLPVFRGILGIVWHFGTRAYPSTDVQNLKKRTFNLKFHVQSLSQIYFSKFLNIEGVRPQMLY